VRHAVNYEAQAAIEFEMALTESSAEPYRFDLLKPASGPWIIDSRPLFLALLEDLRQATAVGEISAKFHLGLVDLLAGLAQELREREGLNRVCLSGGSFQNRFLSEGLERRLAELSFEVFAHSEVPAGDGGLSLGQAMVAAHQPRR
jgi:hydrogenase maturation protein HypF